MNSYIERRVVDEALFIIENKSTVRSVAKTFDVGKSTVHKDLTCRLSLIDKNLHEKVRKILDFNLSERHIRGGYATKKKYRNFTKKI